MYWWRRVMWALHLCRQGATTNSLPTQGDLRLWFAVWCVPLGAGPRLRQQHTQHGVLTQGDCNAVNHPRAMQCTVFHVDTLGSQLYEARHL